MRVKYLKDAEPYQTGDVVDVADDRVDNLIQSGTVEQVPADTELFVKSAQNQNQNSESENKE